MRVHVSGVITLTISNLAGGNYNFYLHGHGAANGQDGIYALAGGSSNYGTNSTANDSYSWNSSVWEQGEQYVVVLEVLVSSNSPVVISVLPDSPSYAIVNGLQIVPSAFSCLPGPNGLISWWQAEGNANDVLGTNNATAYNMSYVSGVVNEGFNFNGTSSYVKAPASASLNTGTNGTGLTLACWINPTDYNARPLFEWNSGSGSDPWGVLFWIYGNAASLYADFIDINTNFNTISAPAGILTTGVFQHAAVTYDTNSGNSVIYYNGTPQVTNNLGSFIPQTSYPLYLGFRPAGGPATYFSGVMDDVSVFNRALSAVEIAALYKAGASTNSVCLPPAPPTITTQPASQSVTAGNDALPFTVAATGTPLLTYQWQFNGVNLSGATGTSLTLANAQPGNAGNYAVIVSNSGGSANSSTAVLTVNTPTITWAPSGLVSWWRAEWDANDALGTNNGTLNGGVTFAPGKVGQAFDLDGSTGYIKIPASASLTMSGASGLSLECWIKPADYSIHPLIEWNNGGTAGVQLWLYGTQSFQGAFVDTSGNPHTLNAPSNLINTNDFQHLAATYDHASGNAVLYYNGAQVLTTNLGSVTPQTGYDLYLGHRPGTTNYYNSLLDEVGVYNRALSATEVAAIYNEGSAGFGFAPTNWLSQYWGSGWATNLNAAATADDVGDGVPNYIKYIQGRNPTNTTVVDTNLVIQLNVYTPLK